MKLATLAAACLLAYAVPAMATGNKHKPSKPQAPSASASSAALANARSTASASALSLSSSLSASSAKSGDSISGAYAGGSISSAGGSSSGVEINNPRQVAPAPSTFLTTGSDSCSGSVGGGLGTTGVSIGFGATTRDEHCEMLKAAKILHDFGLQGAAQARLCMDDKIRAAIESVNGRCPEFRAQQTTATRSVSVHESMFQ